MNIFSGIITKALETTAGLTGDWFVTILLLTLAIKILMFPLSLKQQRAMLISHNLNKAKEKLSKKMGNQTEKVNAALAEIIARHRINPFYSLVVLLIQTPVFFSIYSSILHLSASIGTVVIPWAVSVSSPDSTHIIPVAAGLFQGIGAIIEKNILMFLIAGVVGAIFLWKAPVGLGVYWGVNAVLGLLEKRLYSIAYIQNGFLKVPTVEDLLREV